jgi:hypothetical protein
MGLVLVIALVAIAFRAKNATIYSRITIVVLTLIVLVQVYLGFQLLGGAETMVVSHEATAFVIVIKASGKTHTLQGWDESEPAIVKRAADVSECGNNCCSQPTSIGCTLLVCRRCGSNAAYTPYVNYTTR